ncbi:hypothetical protein D3C72_1810100 [compost metagenome]
MPAPNPLPRERVHSHVLTFSFGHCRKHLCNRDGPGIRYALQILFIYIRRTPGSGFLHASRVLSPLFRGLGSGLNIAVLQRF